MTGLIYLLLRLLIVFCWWMFLNTVKNTWFSPVKISGMLIDICFSDKRVEIKTDGICFVKQVTKWTDLVLSDDVIYDK